MTDYNRLGVKYMIECNDGMTTIVYTGDGKSVRQLPFGVTLPFTVKEIKQMNRFEELRKVAEAAIPHWDGPINREIQAHIDTFNPRTILAMLDLIELQHDYVTDMEESDRIKALEAYDKFKEQL